MRKIVFALYIALGVSLGWVAGTPVNSHADVHFFHGSITNYDGVEIDSFDSEECPTEEGVQETYGKPYSSYDSPEDVPESVTVVEVDEDDYGNVTSSKFVFACDLLHAPTW